MPTWVSKDSLQKPLLHIKSETEIWLSIHDNQHSTFAIIDLKDDAMAVYDSLKTSKHEKKIFESMQLLKTYLKPSWPVSWFNLSYSSIARPSASRFLRLRSFRVNFRDLRYVLPFPSKGQIFRYFSIQQSVPDVKEDPVNETSWEDFGIWCLSLQDISAIGRLFEQYHQLTIAKTNLKSTQEC